MIIKSYIIYARNHHVQIVCFKYEQQIVECIWLYVYSEKRTNPSNRECI